MNTNERRTLNIERRTSKCVLAATLLAASSPWAFAQTNLLSNPGFEIGYSGQRMMDNIDSWTPLTYPVWDWGRIRSAATTPTYDGTNTFQLDAFANYNKVMSQRWPCTTNIVYEVEGWMKSPAGTYCFTPTNGFCYVKIEFFNAAGASLGSEDSIGTFAVNGPTNWTRFTTGPVLPPAGAVTGSALFGYCPGGDDWGPTGDQTVQGFVYVDEMKAFTNEDHTAGVLSNAGFEVRNCAYLPLTNIPYWVGLGTDGGVATNEHRTGQLALQVWGVDSLAGQSWPVTRSNKYACGAYLFSTNFTTTNAYGLLVLQYTDATGTNVILEYQSPHFTSLSSSNEWTLFEVTGVAPSGSVYGRLLCGIVGDPIDFGSSTVWFDDTTQRLVSTTGTVAGLLHNGGFDDGPAGNAYDLDHNGDLPYWDWLGGTNAGFVNPSFKTNGEQSLSITYPANSAAQGFAATTGQSYIVEGYIYNPASEELTGSAYGTLTLEFYTGTNLVSTYDTAHFTNGSPPDTWIKFGVTNHAPWAATGLTAKVLCSINGDTAGFGGALYFDALRADETNIPATNVQAGELWNPGFEYTAPGTRLVYADNWEGFGDASSIHDTYRRSGRTAAKIGGIDNLLRQSWDATQGWRYASSGYAFTPSADPLAGATNLHAVVQMQFLDASSNVLLTYESSWFMTNATPDTWSNLAAEGAAPAGTKYGRTVAGLFGDAGGFSGSVWFDDLTQAVVSTTGTVAGLLGNPGFEDGPPGNCYDLDAANDLPFWDWLGGTNGGFITTSHKYEGSQALAITYPSNLIAQSFLVTTGYTYVFEGYAYTPASEQMTGTAYGVLILEFYRSNSLVSSVESAHFTSSSPSNTWVKLAVTNRAPWTGNDVTCRVLCAVMGSTIDYGGAVYFDGLYATGSYVGATNLQAGEIWNPGFEYTSPGTLLEHIDSWTPLGAAGMVSDSYSHTGQNAVRLYGPETLLAQTWEATQGWKYASAAWAYTPASDPLAGASNLHAVVLLQFFDATATNLLISYESPWFTTNTPAAAWSNLEVIGVAPQGSAWGRTVIGLLGTNTGFGGSVYFDDVTQRVVSTTGTVSGLLHNPGFDDGPSGNAYVLQATNDLPYWQWIGGTNAGFVARDYRKDAEQAFSITYPLNGVAQDWTASAGEAYKAEGYLFTPASSKFSTDGKSSGRLQITFYLDGDTNADAEAVFVSAPFGADQPSNTWVYFAVTGIAPYASTVTGRLTCTILCTDDPTNDTELAGAIYFDQLSLAGVELTSDVSVAASDDPDPVRVGNSLTYAIAVSNAGPHAAGNVVVTDILPSNVNFSSCSLSQGSYAVEDDTVTCTLGTLGYGGTAAVTIVVTPWLEGSITNALSAGTSSTDPVAGNDRAEEDTVVLGPNRSPEISLPGPHTLPVGSGTGFVVSVTDADHDPGLTLDNTVAPSGATFDGTNFAWTAGAAYENSTNPLVFVADDGQGETNSVVTNSTVIVVPYDWDLDGLGDGWEWTHFATLSNQPAGDNDLDGADNEAEYIAGTEPTNASSYFRVQDIANPSGQTNHNITVATVSGRVYTIYFADGALSNNMAWALFGNTNNGYGVWIETNAPPASHTFVDDEGTNATSFTPASGKRFYKLKAAVRP